MQRRTYDHPLREELASTTPALTELARQYALILDAKPEVVEILTKTELDLIQMGRYTRSISEAERKLSAARRAEREATTARRRANAQPWPGAKLRGGSEVVR